MLSSVPQLPRRVLLACDAQSEALTRISGWLDELRIPWEQPRDWQDLTQRLQSGFQARQRVAVISPLTFAGRNVAQAVAELTQVSSLPPESWVWLTQAGALSRDQIERLAKVGVLDFLLETSSVDAGLEEFRSALARAESRRGNPLLYFGDLVSKITGVQLSDEKQDLIQKRLTRRVLDLNLKNLNEYIRYFHRNREQELPHLISQLTTHTTEFFRDPAHFDHLIQTLLPLFRKRGSPIQIWSAACSTGEEVYSLAIALFEAMRLAGEKWEIQILGSDVDQLALQEASRGIYPASAVRKIHPDLASRYFDFGTGEIAHLAKVKDFVWKACSFRSQNLLANSYSLDRFDAIFCRNVFIYFTSEEVTRIATHLSQHLKPEGRLYIGASEIIHRPEAHASSLPAIGRIHPFGLKLVSKAVYALDVDKTEIPTTDAPLTLQEAARDKRTTRPLAKILVVDDSLTIRALLKKILTPEFGFEVVAEASDPLQANELLKLRAVDAITLDIHMPQMDGVTWLTQISNQEHPPVVMISSVNENEALSVLKCLELGAADYLEKPTSGKLLEKADEIRESLKGAIKKGRFKPNQQSLLNSAAPQKLSDMDYRPRLDGHDLLAIGASTGGIEAIRSVLPRFPANSPPTVIVQHIPALFSKLYAQRLNEICQVRVKEVENDELLVPGTAYVAPGGKQFSVYGSQGRFIAKVQAGPADELHKPSVNFLFESVARLMRQNSQLQVAAALLTGMGKDGAAGMKLLRDLGAHTIAQDEASCVVYGMPQAAVSLQAATEVLPLESIPYHLFRGLKKHRSAA